MPNPVTSTTCPANSFTLLIPDSFPFNLAVNPYTGAVIYAPVTPPRFLPIILPDAGIVPFCMSPYTHQLRYSASNTCVGASIQILVVGEIAPDAVDDGLYTTLVNSDLNETAPGLLTNDDLGLPGGDAHQLRRRQSGWRGDRQRSWHDTGRRTGWR